VKQSDKLPRRALPIDDPCRLARQLKQSDKLPVS
jgi:hypothetical protein